MSSLNETKVVLIDVTYKEHNFDTLHTLNYYVDDSMAIGEFDYDADPYSDELDADDVNYISDKISEHLSEHCGRGLYNVTEGETIYLDIS